MDDFNSVILRSLRKSSMLEKARKYRVFTLWPSVLGKLSKHATIRKFDDGVLSVACSSSVWAHELGYMSLGIIKKLNAAMGSDFIKEIKFSEHLWEPASPEEEPAGHLVIPFKRKNKRERKELNLAFTDAKKALKERNELFLSRGYSLCDKCGSLFRGDGDCPYCMAQLEMEWFFTAASKFERMPYLSDEEIMHHFKIGSENAVKMARRRVEARHSQQVLGYLASNGDRDLVPVQESCKKLVCLRAAKKFEDVDEKDLSKILGTKFYKVLKSKWRRI